MAGAVQVITETENPRGFVLVEAQAHESRMGDGRPIAGFYVQRRYHGQRFRIEKPEEFSPNWMRFVEDPPKEWVEKLKKITKVSDVKELMWEPPFDPNAPFPMSQAGTREMGVMNYANGRVTPRRNA